MITAEMEALYAKLLSMAPMSVHRNDAKDYVAFQLHAPKGKRNAVSIRREGVSFFTEDKFLLEKLTGLGIDYYKIAPDEGSSKRKYRFTKLTPEIIDAHSDDFSEAV